nr:transposase [Fontibacillus phaseoli]
MNAADRAYAKCTRFDNYVEQKRDFVIRLKDEVVLHEPLPSRRQRPEDSFIEQGVICQLGTGVNRSRLRNRVVKFRDSAGNPITLATSLKRISAEKIAEIYKLRWHIEVFFRWIKQHLKFPALFGTTPNAVYSQLFIALLVYLLLKAFTMRYIRVPAFSDLTFADFTRLLGLHHLPAGWVLLLYQYWLINRPGKDSVKM